MPRAWAWRLLTGRVANGGDGRASPRAETGPDVRSSGRAIGRDIQKMGVAVGSSARDDHHAVAELDHAVRSLRRIVNHRDNRARVGMAPGETKAHAPSAPAASCGSRALNVGIWTRAGGLSPTIDRSGIRSANSRAAPGCTGFGDAPFKPPGGQNSRPAAPVVAAAA